MFYFQITLKSAAGLPPSLSHFVFCQYLFFNDSDLTVVPPGKLALLNSNQIVFEFKSNNKTIQSWALRMPVACNANDLDRLMDGEAREKESEEKYQEVLAKWDIKHSVKEYLDFINLLKKRRQNA